MRPKSSIAKKEWKPDAKEAGERLITGAAFASVS
jgi:hypothetical protein